MKQQNPRKRQREWTCEEGFADVGCAFADGSAGATLLLALDQRLLGHRLPRAPHPSNRSNAN
eukprot:2374252-Rhodomonas_salina.2